MSAIVRGAQFWVFLSCVTYLGLTPEPDPALSENFSDKVLHFTGYLLLLLSCNLAYRPGRQLGHKIALLFCYSIAIEALQHLIPTRSFSFADLLANLGGLLIGGLLLLLTCRSARPSRRDDFPSKDTTF